MATTGTTTSRQSESPASPSAASNEDSPMREFYVPATFQFSSEPGRIERFLTKVFRALRRLWSVIRY